MKRFLIVGGFVLLMVIGGIFQVAVKSFAGTTIANPWVDCEADFNCAKKVSGINFPLRLSNYWIRAMKGMIEISYPFDEFRSVSVRKTEKYMSDDISGVYTNYKINKIVKFNNGVDVFIRANGKKVYVMNMAAGTGFYSAYCEQGMSMREAEGVYEVIKEAEGPEFEKIPKNSKYSFCELGDLVGKDVKRIKYGNYYVDYHSKEFKKTRVLKFAKECLFERISSQYEMDCCMTTKMYPER